jgi:hypothetical protein
MVGSSEHENQSFEFHKDGEFLDKLSYYQLLIMTLLYEVIMAHAWSGGGGGCDRWKLNFSKMMIYNGKQKNKENMFNMDHPVN